MRTKRANCGFTLVEILIVVVILGILAAIVIPQFTQASTEAKLSSLQSNLQSIRSQIELFKIQHNDLPPTAADNFVNEMTLFTDVGRTVGTGAGFIYGPYLTKMPVNPFSGLAVIGSDPTGSGCDWIYINEGGSQYTFDVGMGTDSDQSSSTFIGLY